jgi:hypothetical protein
LDVAVPKQAGASGKTQQAAAPAAKAAPAADPGYELVIKGLYLSNPADARVVDEFGKALAASPFFSIDPAKGVKPTVRDTQNANGWTFGYEFHLPLKKPYSL